MLDIFRHFNWVDLVMAAVFIRAVYIGIKRGFADEILHLIGVALAAFVAFHYYLSVSSFLQRTTFFSETVSHCTAYLFLWVFVAFVSKLVRDGLRIIFKVETVSFVNKCGGLLVSFGRGILLASLIIWFLYTTGHGYIREHLRMSFSGGHLARAGSIFYQKTFEGLVVKLFPQERLNQDIILSAQKVFPPKNR